MKGWLIEAVGTASGILTTAAYIPGVIKVWKAKPAPALAVSGLQYVTVSIGIFGWLIYGIMLHSRPIIIANAVTLVLALSILLYKHIYG